MALSGEMAFCKVTHSIDLLTLPDVKKAQLNGTVEPSDGPLDDLANPIVVLQQIGQWVFVYQGDVQGWILLSSLHCGTPNKLH